MKSLSVFIISLIILVLFSRLLDKFLSEIFSQGRYRWLIWPGIAVHEISHAFMGKLMGAKITHISLFSKTGGSVTHTRPRVPLIGRPLTSMAPLFGCIIAIIGLAHAFGFDDAFMLTGFEMSFIGNLDRYFSDIGLLFAKNIGSWRFWLFLYFMLAITTAIAPSNQDFKNSWWGIGFILIILGALLRFNIGTDFLESVLSAISSLFALGVLFETIVILIILPFWIWKRRKYTFS